MDEDFFKYFEKSFKIRIKIVNCGNNVFFETEILFRVILINGESIIPDLSLLHKRITLISK